MNFKKLQDNISQIMVKPQPYASMGELIADVLLIGANCIYYYPKDSATH